MRSSHVSAVIVLGLIGLLLAPQAHAGSYNFLGYTTGSFLLIDYNDNQAFVPVSEPKAVGISISYDAGYAASLTISSGSSEWPGFISEFSVGESVAPDVISFSFQGEPLNPNPTQLGPGLPSDATLTLYAPAGTWANASQPPPTLDGFGISGYWSLSANGFLSGDGGPLAPPAPEPSSLLTLTLGIAGVSLAYFARRSRNGR